MKGGKYTLAAASSASFFFRKSSSTLNGWRLLLLPFDHPCFLFLASGFGAKSSASSAEGGGGGGKSSGGGGGADVSGGGGALPSEGGGGGGGRSPFNMWDDPWPLTRLLFVAILSVTRYSQRFLCMT